MMKKTMCLALLTVLLLFTLTACGQQAQATPTPEPTVAPTSAPAGNVLFGVFETLDLEGNTADESIFTEPTLTIVNVWATFCGPCLSEMPDLGALATDYAARGVRFVGIVLDVLNADGSYSETQLETAREIVARTGAGYQHLLPSESLSVLLDTIDAVPTTYAVDSAGRQIGETLVGSQDKESWIALIELWLAEVEA